MGMSTFYVYSEAGLVGEVLAAGLEEAKQLVSEVLPQATEVLSARKPGCRNNPRVVTK